ncbi:MAG: SusC/RagA family TonB-linked outer membrane protein [Bacteroides sp.]|nr:SusC/RagA family TonB-linked outer membrane protein [Bacteroides sp.]
MERQKISARVGISRVLFTLAICMALFLNVRYVGAQNRTINVKGVVNDAMGPVIGASVVEKENTSNGTITDIDGNFSLKVSSNATLVVSFIGYKTQEVPVNGKTSFTINLAEDTEMLDEVVVVGYGTMRKKDLTGSVIQIRPDKLANEAPKTVQDVLRGTPGLNVGMDASAKGGGSLQIRGQRSLYTDGNHNDPLIILDGMMFYGELSEINPDDIGQIDVLKDASSAAVYGAKAANGVIIISTKKGLQGKPIIRFNSNIGISTMGANRKVYDAEGYMKYRSDWYTATTYGVNPETGTYEEYQTNKDKYPAGYYAAPTQANLDKYGISLDQWRAYTGEGSDISDNEIWGNRLLLEGTNLQNYLDGRTFDWYDQSFRTALNQDYNVSLSGASNYVNYYFSLGYLDNEGVVAGDDYRAFSSNMKVNAKVTKWLKIGANVNFQDRTDGNQKVDWEKQITVNSPFASYKNEDGELEIYPMGNVSGNRGYNYDFEQQYKEYESGYTVLNTILNAKVNLPFNISYTFNIAPRYQWFYKRTFDSSKHPDRLNGSAARNNGKRFDWALNNTLTWDQTFAQKHHVVLTLVQEAEERRKWSDDLSANNLAPTDALGFHYVKAADKTSSSFSSDDMHETADGMLARVFYSYDNRYMFTGSFRRDGYSAFGTSNPRANFFSAAVAWTFTNEKFFNWKPLSAGKLRFSWGQNGNRSLSNPYIALANLSAGMGATQGYIDASGNTVEYRYYTMDRLANTHLEWEKTTAWNIGLDFGFLNDRITGSIDYYNMPTTDMIMNQSLPGFSGFGSITCNLGEVQNRGIEISLSTTNIRNKILEWNTTLGFSYNKNKIKHLYYEYENVLDAQGNVIGTKERDDISNKWFIGRPIGAIWDYKVTGIWQKDEVEEAAKYGQRPGDPKVWNNPDNDKINADGTTTIVYDNDDKVFLGQTSASYNWSMRNEFVFFKNLTFSFNIYSKMGQKSQSENYLNKDNAGSKVTNGQNVYKKEYWTVDNPTNEYGRLDAQGPSGLASPKKLYNRSFIRLENIALSYTLPKKWTSKWSIEKVNVSGSIKNVAVWAKDWNYWDPETGGIAPRVFNIGLNLTF